MDRTAQLQLARRAVAVLVVACRLHAVEVSAWRVTATSGVALSLPVPSRAGPHFFEDDGGRWFPLEGAVADGSRLVFSLGRAQLGADGLALVVLGKPEWMVLEDREPPEITAVRVNGADVSLREGEVDLGCLDSGDADLEVYVSDRANPLSAASASLALSEPGRAVVSVDTSSLPPVGTSGRMTVRLAHLAPGSYTGRLMLADRAPAANVLSLPVSFRVMGISIGDDGQSVTLANADTSYVLRPDREKQLLLPGGTWAKLTTRTAGTWLYPRRFTTARVLQDTPEAKTVSVRASAQGIKGEPVEGLGELEYALTVRADSPALFVTTRSYNVSATAAENSANWGWLPAPYYVTPEGRKEWRGKARDAYLDVGQVGWVWLAPRVPGQPGLVWMSSLKFGESRFDTMLLYSTQAKSAEGESVDMRFAIAPAAGPAQAEAIYSDLRGRGLLEQSQDLP